MNPEVYFDDALPRFARAVSDAWGSVTVESNLFLRDAFGRLTFVLLDEGHDGVERRNLSEAVAQMLGPYVDGPQFAIATPEELFDQALREHPEALTIVLKGEIFTGAVRLVDRRMVGADWLRAPAASAAPPIRYVFASLKGGVGRSTALCVVAAEFAKGGRRVLAIDLDLEAPGLGTFLLSKETLPDFGLLDFLVESEVGQNLGDTFFADMVSPSWLSAGLGRVDVIPAIGRRSIDNPQNVLAKIARAYLADGAGQTASTFQDRMTALVSSFSEPSRYDLILIDARAGLHETTAAALLGLGADVLLFGLDQSQTYEGYKLLFSHLGTLPQTSVMNWRDRLTLVQGKASAEKRLRGQFADRMQAIVDEWLHRPLVPKTDDAALLKDTFNVEWDDSMDDSLLALDDAQDIPVISIYEDDRFRNFDPSVNRDVLSSSLYSTPYVELLDLVRERLTNPSRSEVA